MKNIGLIGGFLMLVLTGYICPLRGQEEAPTDTLTDLSLADLLNLKITLASKTEQPVAEAPSIVSVITSQDIENMGARDLEDIFRSIAGFDTTLSPWTGTQGISIRGLLSTNGTNNNIKFMINGHALRSANAGPFHSLDFIPIRNVDRIEVIRGPGSALYGANAFVGVINIITKTETSPSRLALESGSFDEQKATVFWNGYLGEVWLGVSAFWTEREGHEKTIRSDAAALAFGPDFSAAPGPTTNDGESLALKLDLVYKNWKLNTFYHRLNRNYAVGIAGALTDENDLETDNGFAELEYHRAFRGEKLKINFKTYYDFSNFLQKLEVFPEETAGFFSQIYADAEPYPVDSGIIGHPGVDFLLWGGELSLDYQINENVQILAGTLYDHSEIFNATHVANGNVADKPLTINGQDFQVLQYLGGLVDIGDIPGGNWIEVANRKNLAAYAQAMVNLKQMVVKDSSIQSLALTFGVRYDDYSDTGTSTNPRVGLVFSPNERWFFKTLYGTAFRAPTFAELYQINNPANLGNPDLAPEKIKTGEFQIGCRLSDRSLITLSFFDIRNTNKIQLEQITFQNIGKIRSRGFELESKFAFPGGHYIYANGTRQNTVNETNRSISGVLEGGEIVTWTQGDFEVGNIPKWIFNVGGYWQVNNFFHCGLQVNHTGRRERTEELIFEPGPIQGITTGNLTRRDRRPVTPGRTLVNANLNFALKNAWQIKLSGFNLLDQDHRDPDNTITIEYDIPRAGASFFFNVLYSF